MKLSIVKEEKLTHLVYSLRNCIFLDLDHRNNIHLL